MSFTESVKFCLSNYVTFTGRASRSEYWWFALFVFLLSLVFGLVDQLLFGDDSVTQSSNQPISALFSLAILLPMLAAGWRRMHDTGKPGWYLLLPMLISFAMFFFAMLGVLTFVGLESAGADQDSLRRPAALLGITGMISVVILQLVFAVLLLWWLTRPSDAGDNAYGPAPNSLANH